MTNALGANSADWREGFDTSDLRTSGNNRWVEQILTEFPANLARLWIAADPEDVLLDEDVLSGLRSRGFDVLPFEDSVVFRAEYEERYRVAWDRDEDGPARSLVLHLRGTNVDDLPWDYLRQARRISLSLADLFPTLSYAVVRQIGAEYLKRLFDAQFRHAPQILGETATKEFILTHIFRISPHLISRPAELWKELLQLHFRNACLPPILSKHVAHVLEQQGIFTALPIGELFSSKNSLVRVVQHAWYRHLENLGICGTRIGEPLISDEGSNFDIPFDHPDVRPIIHLMFLEGVLHPLQVQPGMAKNIPDWAKAGIVPDPGAMRNLVRDGIENLMQTLPTADSSYRDWIHLSRRMGELIARFHGLESAHANGIKGSVMELQNSADERLRKWVNRHYADLSSLPVAKGPVMVHHIPRFLSIRRGAGEFKIALLVFDGLAVDQWIQIRESLIQQPNELSFDESACFAWIPTLTSVSRQALFSGLKPREFTDTIDTTAQESAQWARFWRDQGLQANEVLYLKGIKRTDQLADLDEALATSSIKIAGIVVDTVDEIVHGAVLGKRGVANQITSWCESGFVSRLLKLLLDKRFHVYITADHGNVEAEGQGRPNQGTAPELRGERVRVYHTDTLAAESAISNANTYRLPVLEKGAGLPADFKPLFAGGRAAFVPLGEQVVVHGGNSVEELIVPFVKVSYVNEIE